MPKTAPRTELYLIRHGQTVMNTKPEYVGGRSSETPLTATGIEQSKRLGRVMLAKSVLPHAVFSSPAIRAVDTARYSLAEMGLDVRPLVHDALHELGLGQGEGKLRSEVYTDTVSQDIARLGKDFRLEDGESMNDVGLRMNGWITETFAGESNEEPQRHFVYTHGGAIKYLASRILDWDHQRTYRTEIDNASVNLFVLEGGVCSVMYLNRDVEQI